MRPRGQFEGQGESGGAEGESAGLKMARGRRKSGGLAGPRRRSETRRGSWPARKNASCHGRLFSVALIWRALREKPQGPPKGRSDRSRPKAMARRARSRSDGLRRPANSRLAAARTKTPAAPNRSRQALPWGRLAAAWAKESGRKPGKGLGAPIGPILHCGRKKAIGPEIRPYCRERPRDGDHVSDRR